MGQEAKYSHIGWKVFYIKKSSLFNLFERTLLGGFYMANGILLRDQAYLESLVAEAEEAVQGKRVGKEDELDEPADKTEKKL
jgi:hypothetical protein